jgi:demethylmenaquinone methyltransferase/2-methoxy-6-polyprenyl-1,4-benzoquinol methylase
MAIAVTPYKNDLSKKEQVATMFNNIASRYDLLNSLLSFGTHTSWRKKAIDLLRKENPKTILDIATGTADLAIEALKLDPIKIVGVDISEGMLRLGQEKLNKRGLTEKIQLIKGDSEQLPFEPNSFDAVTVAFGVRNFENLDTGLKNIFSVLKPGGTLVVLEFSKPTNFIVKGLYNFYFNRVTPFVGGLFSKDASAYSYLPESVNAFPDGENFIDIMKQNGFSSTSRHSLTFNIANIYTGKK